LASQELRRETSGATRHDGPRVAPGNQACRSGGHCAIKFTIGLLIAAALLWRTAAFLEDALADPLIALALNWPARCGKAPGRILFVRAKRVDCVG
jgi:hypothetical protein